MSWKCGRRVTERDHHAPILPKLNNGNSSTPSSIFLLPDVTPPNHLPARRGWSCIKGILPNFHKGAAVECPPKNEARNLIRGM